ncbi:TetR/AcrR family transcriptional regulator [Jannaschia sp. Os4]|uniref:TetR/AcrR family transcriptional regulator n=1 Tax=Jannaschia sp. Os4 TaxID=2807617 RepID=UPI00193AB05F|nr:TetR/AcrR family transcriptional regulator [Jannaschia sp. Os4]MBM2576306.1 TetR/AcrR family transcriptional regulator [Jannaschia sp. Os4]
MNDDTRKAEGAVEPAPRRRRRGPSPAKTAQTRAAIVDAALATFLRDGFEGTRMIDVARSAGVAKGTIYLYFPTKEALFEGVLTDALGSPLGAIDAMPEEDESVRAFLLATALPILRDLEESGKADLLRLILREGGRFPEIAAAYRRIVLDPGWREVAALAARARARGELRTDALERLPLLLVAPAVTATVWNGLFPEEPLAASEAFERFVEAVFVE